MLSRYSFASTVRTTALLALLTGLLVFIGRALGGPGGMLIAFGFAIAMNFGAYWFSDKIALKMSGAREVSAADAPELHRIVADLAQRASLPMPRVYIVDDPTPNAFATGRDPQHAAVAATTGILGILSREELAGVMAHELAHVKHRDTLIQAIVATVVGSITMIASMAQWALIFGGFGGGDDEEDGGGSLVGGLLMVFLAPLAAAIIQFAISRSREYAADAGGADICGNPLALASALQKLERGAEAVPTTAQPAMAHQYIINPFSGGGLMTLFSTHPPVAERVARLEALATTNRVMVGAD
jgi:heat shock protein HtpX